MSNVPVPVASNALAERFRQVPPPATGGAGKMFLRFDFQTGTWSCGKEQIDATDSEALVNIQTIGHGWSMWVNGAVKKNVVPFDQVLPQPMMPEAGASPQECRVLAGAFMDEEGGEFIYETNSLGGRNGVDGLIREIIMKVTSGEATFIFPLIQLSSAFYIHKTHGRKIFTPVFKIIGWADINGVRQGDTLLTGPSDDADEAEETQEQPTRRRRSV